MKVLLVVGFTEAISIAKAIEERHTEYEVDPNQELIAIGSGNIIGSFAQSYPSTASFSRSAIQDHAPPKEHSVRRLEDMPNVFPKETKRNIT